MTEEAISEEVLLKRLKRIEGQVRGIQNSRSMPSDLPSRKEETGP